MAKLLLLPAVIVGSIGCGTDAVVDQTPPPAGDPVKADAGVESDAMAPTAAAADAPNAPPDFESLRRESEVVDRALRMKAEVDNANAYDLHVLWARVQQLMAPLDAAEREEFANRVCDRMKDDAKRLLQVRAYFEEGPGKERWWDGIELRKAVEQFLGSDDTESLYGDAVRLARRPQASNPFSPDLPEMYLEPHLTAALKTLLLYAVAVGDGLETAGDLPQLEQLVLVYPVPLSPTLPADLLDGLLLVDRRSLPPKFLIPNAGFVMGGVLVDGENHGIDCSAFVSHCTNCSDRLTTWVMEFCYRELALGVDDFDAREKEIRKEFLAQWGLRDALRAFEAVQCNSVFDLQPGDVLVRRWGGRDGSKREGNSTIFLAPKSGSTVWGIECNRLHNPHTGERFDGVVYRVYDLSTSNVDVYVLRAVGDDAG